MATMQQRVGEFLLSEGNGQISVDECTVASGQGVLVSGTVIAVVAGEAVIWDPDAIDGSEVVYGVLYNTVDATDANQAATAVVRLAEVSQSKLVFASGVTAQQDAYDALAVKNIIARA